MSQADTNGILALLDLQQPIDCLIHIGAGRGEELPAYAAAAIARLVLVEPQEALAADLRKRCTDLPQAQVIRTAVADPSVVDAAVDATAQLHCYNLPQLDSLATPTQALTDCYPGARQSRQEDVPVCSAAQLCADLGLTAADSLVSGNAKDLAETAAPAAARILVLQALGSEAAILQSLQAQQLLACFDDIILHAPQQPWHHGAQGAEALTAMLQEHGFTVHRHNRQDADCPFYHLRLNRAALQAQALKDQLQALQEELSRERVAHASLQEQYDDLSQQHQRQRKAHKKLTEELAQAQAVREKARLHVDDLKAQLKTGETDKGTIATLQEELAKARQARDDLQQQLNQEERARGKRTSENDAFNKKSSGKIDDQRQGGVKDQDRMDVVAASLVSQDWAVSDDREETSESKFNAKQKLWSELYYSEEWSEVSRVIEGQAKDKVEPVVRNDDRSIIIDLHREVPGVYLAKHLLENSDKFDRAILIVNSGELCKLAEKAARDLCVSEKVTIFSKEYFYGFDNGISKLYAIEEIEKICSMDGVWHWLYNDKSQYQVAQKGWYQKDHCVYTAERLILLARLAFSNADLLLKKFNVVAALTLDLNAVWKAALYELAHHKNIPVAYLLPTRMAKYLSFSPSPFEVFVHAYAAMDSVSPQCLGVAKGYVDTHLNNTREYHDSAQLSPNSREIIKNGEVGDDRGLLKMLKSLENKRAEHKRMRSLGEAPRFMSPSVKYFEESCLQACRSWSRVKSGRSEECTRRLGQKKFILFAMQSEPETAISLYAPHLPSQKSLVDLLARAIPPNYTLAVKDHPRMYGLRDERYYSDMEEKNPNVCIIPSTDDALCYMQEAALVITIAGTVGMEALMFGTPSVCLGTAHYQRLYGCTRISDLFNLRPRVNEVLTCAWDEGRMKQEVTNYIAACMQEGVSIGWWSDVGSDGIDYNFQSEEFSAFCNFVHQKMNGIMQDQTWTSYGINYGYRDDVSGGARVMIDSGS